MTSSWLKQLAAATKETHHDLYAKTLPRPLGLAFLITAIGIGARWLPLPQAAAAIKQMLPFVAGVLVVGALMRVVFRGIEAYGVSNAGLKSAAGIGRAVTWVVGLGIIAVLVSDAMGVSLAPALTALGVGSLAVALALQDTLSNFFAGLYLLADKPLRPGDFVRLEGGHEGYVEAIGWRSTQLRTLVESFIIVPNATLSKAVVTNFKDGNPRLLIEIRLDVAEDTDMAAAERALSEEAASAVDLEGVQAVPVPYVRLVSAVTEAALTFVVYVKTMRSADAALVQHSVRKRVYARLKKEGIKLALIPLVRPKVAGEMR